MKWGMVNGMSKTLFVPGRAATREQAAVVLSRLYGRLHPASAGIHGDPPDRRSDAGSLRLPDA